jgi:RNA polymerase primary sigma factor
MQAAMILRTDPRPALTASEEVSLARRVSRGDSRAKERMVEANLGLVRAIATRYRGRGVPLEDLVQEGTVGLVRAVERFDHRRATKFSTYAVWWIRRSVLDAIGASQAIRIPARAHRQLAAVRRAESELGRGDARCASAEAIARRTGLGPRVVVSLRCAARVTASLDEPACEDRAPLGDLVADENAVDPHACAIANEDRRAVSAMLRLLPPRHREVLVRRYGLNRDRAETHAEIARSLGVGEERSRQLEHEALHRLRTFATAPTTQAA